MQDADGGFSPPDSPISYVGPHSHHDIVLHGRRVPYVEAHPIDGGRIDLVLDGRFGLVVSAAEAERFVPFLAHAIAIASGYTAHPDAERDGPNPRHPFPRVTGLLVEGG